MPSGPRLVANDMNVVVNDTHVAVIIPTFSNRFHLFMIFRLKCLAFV
jgi:hypothetical protein